MPAQKDWRSQNRHLQILKAAKKGRYGVMAAIAYNIEQILANAAVQKSAVPISIHLDHAQDENLIKRAAKLPFDSIMVDMLHYEKDVNLAKTAELAAYLQDRGIATEAESGRIEGGEEGVMDTAGLESVKTTVEEAEQQ
ncbi:uncharacterized protein PV09_09676 [Verruconis gallopava]|uniref:Fructose-bisphosphate aldolase n=1 Tax=Verruconis gallopava TaxID=253628 RepID=A0A0D1YCY6_9PEZI|nr:uncharacterized protein PV09_09676 [Verruconis gallopava]KIV98511.1 hypothetical protein PV09_09676 [Verruconis gallopava]